MTVPDTETGAKYLLPEDLIFTQLLYTAREFSNLIGHVVSADWIERKTNDGEIQCTYVGRWPRYSRADIEKFIADRCHKATRKPR
jgi:hypothetical protein